MLAVLRTLDTLSYPTFDSISLTTIREVPNYRIEIDTTVQRGDTLSGVVIFADTTLRRELASAYGCDSLEVYQVMVLLNNSEAVEREDGIKVYPNPASGYLIVSSGAERLEGLELRDVTGRSIPIASSAPSNVMLLDLRGIPSGIYLLTGRENGRIWTRRVRVR